MNTWLKKIVAHLSSVYGEKFIEVKRYRLVKIKGVEKLEVRFMMRSNGKIHESFEVITLDTLDILR